MSPNDNAPTRKALGRGLAALIPTAPAGASPSVTSATDTSSGLRYLPVEKIRPNKKQPRKYFDPDKLSELAASIREHGVLQPIVVRRKGEGYEIVAGERRWRACSKAGVHDVPAIVKDFSDTEHLQAALVENIQRADLDPLEEAEAYSRLIREHGLKQEEVALAVGKSRVAITNSLRLLRLPDAVLDMIGEGKLTPGHARPIISLEKDEDKIRLAEQIIQRKWSVRDAETRAKAMKKSAQAVADKSGPTPAERSVEERLMRALATKVKLNHKAGKGKLEVYFNSFEELDAIMARMRA